MFKTNKNKQISIIKGTEKIFEEKWKNYSEKAFIWVNSPFSPALFFKKSNIYRFQKTRQNNYIL